MGLEFEFKRQFDRQILPSGLFRNDLSWSDPGPVEASPTLVRLKLLCAFVPLWFKWLGLIIRSARAAELLLVLERTPSILSKVAIH